MFLLGKIQEKHPGYLPPTVQDLPPQLPIKWTSNNANSVPENTQRLLQFGFWVPNQKF